MNINFKAEYGISSSAIEREFVDAETYASLANEARASRYQDPVYDASDLEIIKYNLDPDLYPNVDWHDALLKKAPRHSKLRSISAAAVRQPATIFPVPTTNRAGFSRIR